MRRANLSVPVPVIALVSRYLTNKLIGHGPLDSQQVSEEVPAFDHEWCYQVLPAVSRSYP